MASAGEVREISALRTRHSFCTMSGCKIWPHSLARRLYPYKISLKMINIDINKSEKIQKTDLIVGVKTVVGKVVLVQPETS